MTVELDWYRQIMRIEGQSHLFLEQAEGYVKALEKSNSLVLR